MTRPFETLPFDAKSYAYTSGSDTFLVLLLLNSQGSGLDVLDADLEIDIRHYT